MSDENKRFSTGGALGGGRSTSIKIVLVGPSNAGKTSIAKRFTTDTFDEFQDMTVGSSFFSKQVKSNKSTVRVELWDTAGQEKFRSVAPMYFRNAAGALLVFDSNVPSSFEDCEKQWLPELLPHLKNSTDFIVLCANKADILKNDEATEQFMAKVEMSASQQGITCFRTSAKKGDNVDAVFQHLVDKIVLHRQQLKRMSSLENNAAGQGPIMLPTPEASPERSEPQEKKSGCVCKN